MAVNLDEIKRWISSHPKTTSLMRWAPEEYRQTLRETFPWASKTGEHKFCLLNNISSPPICGRDGCDSLVAFDTGSGKSYQEFCSATCRALHHANKSKSNISGMWNNMHDEFDWVRRYPRPLTPDETSQLMDGISKLGKFQKLPHHLVVLGANLVPWVSKISEVAFAVSSGLTSPPVCQHCGERVSFRNSFDGYPRYCSTKCRRTPRATALEDQIRGMLTNIGVSFESEVKIGPHIVDFKIGNCIVEAFGDYWHANPTKFQADYDRRGTRADAIWRKDAQKLNTLAQQGFKVKVVWESDVTSTTKDDLDRWITQNYLK